MRIVFLIRSLDSGGAERQLVSLVGHLDPGKFSVTVVTFYAGGEIASELHGLPGVRLASADKRSRWDIIGFAWRLLRQVREARPEIIHGYMYGANELAVLLARGVGACVVWGVRASGLDMSKYDWTTRLLSWTGAKLSRYADAIIANSEAGRNYHIGLGYPARKFVVIPNGIDTQLYKYDAPGRQRVRTQWQVADKQVLIGIVARLDPMKDHETFLRAAGELSGWSGSVRFVVVGGGPEPEASRLKRLAEQLGIAKWVIWAGARRDMSAVYSAIDIATSSSAFGEGFSNSMAEAMACETVCVATDVGDARTLLGETGEIVQPAAPQALALAWRKLLGQTPQEREAAGRRARARIIECFSVQMLARRTTDVLLQIASDET